MSQGTGATPFAAGWPLPPSMPWRS